MDAETFLVNFGTVTEAPGGIDRLRELILDLAVRGELVPQLSNEDAASAELRRVMRSPDWRVPARERGTKRDPRIEELAGVARIPEGWTECRMEDIVQLLNGRAYGRNELLDKGTPVIRIQNLNGGDNWYYSDLALPPDKMCDAGDLLFAWSASFGPYIWKGPRAIFHYHIWKIHLSPAIRKNYLYFVLQHLTAQVREQSHGLAMRHMTKARMERWPILLPPIAEQERIVAKVDELMQLCDDLEARQQARQQVTTRLRASSLDALTNAATHDDLHTARIRIQANWEALTDHPDSIDAVRQTLLHLAVRGKLVSQQQQDRPALELIDQIRVERHQQGLRSGMEAAGKPCFRIPATWAWTTFGFVTDARLGKMLDKAKNTGPYRSYLRNTNVQWFRFELDDVAELRLEDSEYEEYELHVGDLLICEGGEPGRAAVCDDTVAGLIFQKALHRARPLLGIEPWYLAFLLRSYAAGGLLAPYFTGATIKHLTGRSLARLPVPLPPVDEQRRIVDRVWELMRLCDDLEAGLASRRQSHEQLARALTSMAS